MSYILEALRRAERDRRRNAGDPAAQVAAPAAYPPARQRTRRWIVAIAGLVVALTAGNLAFFLYFRHPSPPSPARSAARAQPPASAGSAGAGMPRPATLAAAATAEARGERAETEVPVLIPAGAHDESGHPITAADDIQSFDDLAASASSRRQPARPAPAPRAPGREDTADSAVSSASAVQHHAPPSARTTPSASGLAASASGGTKTGSLAPDASGDTSGDAKPLTTAPIALGAPEPVPGDTDLRMMPDDYRAAFPQFTVQVHVYDPDQDKSWVMIDNQRYAAGSSIPQGPKIERIVPEGIVFDWQGKRVLYPTH